MTKSTPIETKTLPLEMPPSDGSDPCPMCGGLPSNLDTKAIRDKQQARWLELRLKHGTADFEGMTHKVWRSVGGTTARASHQNADGQRVAINDYFKIGNHRLFLPSDPNAPFDETANCRCYVDYEKNDNFAGGSGSDVLQSRTNPNLASQPINMSNPSLADLLHHYFTGNGRSVSVPISVLNLPPDLLNFQDNAKKFDALVRSLPLGYGTQQISIRLGYRNPFDFSFGGVSLELSGTIRYTRVIWEFKGRAKASDRFDFNPLRLADRSIFDEAATRAFGSTAGKAGKAFKIVFTGYKQYELIGKRYSY